MKVLRLTKTTKLTQDGGLFNVYTIAPSGVSTLVLSSSRAEMAAKAFDHYEKTPTVKFIP